MKKIIIILLLILICPLYGFAMVCNSTGGGTTGADNITSLDNNTHNNCVDGDKVAWAISKIHFLPFYHSDHYTQKIKVLLQ